MAERYNTEQQKQFCANWQSSGMSKQDFCKANNISKSGLYKWLNKFGYKSSAQDEVKFLPIQTEEAIAERGLEILFPNGVLVRGTNKLIKELVRELLQ
jgi:hypothetical protein